MQRYYCDRCNEKIKNYSFPYFFRNKKITFEINFYMTNEESKNPWIHLCNNCLIVELNKAIKNSKRIKSDISTKDIDIGKTYKRIKDTLFE